MASLTANNWTAAQEWKTTWDTPILVKETKQKKSAIGQGVITEKSAKSASAQDSLEAFPSFAPEAASTQQLNFVNLGEHEAWTALSVLNAAMQKQAEDEKAAKIEEELSRQNLYKTELCRSFVDTGFCRYGVKCQFAHGSHEIRPLMRHPKYKTEVCKNFATTGHCHYGLRCRFIHHGHQQTPPNETVWSSSWTSEPTPAGVSPIMKKQQVLVDEEEDESELETSMKRLAIFQRIAT